MSTPSSSESSEGCTEGCSAVAVWLVFMAILFGLNSFCNRSRMTAEKLEAQVKSELPEGSESTAVVAFINKIGMHYRPAFDVKEGELDPSRWNAWARDPRLDGKRERIKKGIPADMPGPCSFGGCDDVHAIFYLDDGGKLVVAVVKEMPDPASGIGF